MKSDTKPQAALAKRPAEETLIPAFFREEWPSDDWFRPLLPLNGNTWSLLRQMEENANRWFSPATLPRIDVSEDDTEWLVEAEIPGACKEDITVELRDGTLYLQAQSRQETSEEKPEANGNRRYYRQERRAAWMERALSVPVGVEQEKITCDYKDGILRCHLPKKPGATTQGRKIPVEA